MLPDLVVDENSGLGVIATVATCSGKANQVSFELLAMLGKDWLISRKARAMREIVGLGNVSANQAVWILVVSSFGESCFPVSVLTGLIGHEEIEGKVDGKRDDRSPC